LYTEYNFEVDRLKSAEITNMLHPTPAVCGYPFNEALDFIKENEGYNREFYSGYLGPVYNNGDRQLFVNLRCMRIYEEDMVLFAGGGINKGSDPEKEWTETENKMKTLLNCL
ncbi:MAG: chorismate-binding protein, partial [Bacteroidia bacterium]|nr:chorismate-binding protein [Bacteroidia bacterium]